MNISVYITSYNQKAFLIEAIESVLAQTLRPSQVIIVDDCSSDSSQEVIAGYAARYPDLFTPVYHQRNLGVAQTRIDALQAVTGDYVTYVDGDDRFLPTKLEKEAGLLQRCADAQIAFSNNYYMTADGIRTGVWAKGELMPQGDVFQQTFARDFPRRSLFRMELVEYQAWKQVGFHDPNLTTFEDFDMRIRLTKRCRAVYYDEPLSEIRVHGTGLSSLSAERHLASLEYIYRKNLSLLADLDPATRKYVQRRVKDWIAGVARRASVQMLDSSPGRRVDRQRALRYYFKALQYEGLRYLHGRLLTKILLPEVFVARLSPKN